MQHILDRIPEEWGKHLGVPNEWLTHIDELDSRLAEIDPNYIIHQCKTKFGSLRFYYQVSDEVSVEDQKKMQDLVNAYEYASFKWATINDS